MHQNVAPPGIDNLVQLEASVYTATSDARALSEHSLSLGFARIHARVLEMVATQLEFSLMALRQLRGEMLPPPTVFARLAENGWQYRLTDEGHTATRGTRVVVAGTLPLLLSRVSTAQLEVDS
ncbi:hypothetical protein HUA74_43925 [Myxococcus sp. CA051A]|uniref:hypothetical protein n=1 Tax=Myxococcus sp. CA051A TaxID=2741739 RepID=UPI00157A74B1|nr:hypothetical protein [Myxococcus sp. CA051A]NTX67618.1 hypothetical protein [Myxococcus sp. CA051A]